MQRHPDFEFEAERLEYTIHYMQRLLAESQRDVDASQEQIRHSMADLDYLDSSLSYINILTNTRFFEMARSQKETFEAVQQKPYFARIHFQPDDEKDQMLYIGKTSVFHQETQDPIIVDWRSPVANVYYDGRLGDLTYDVRGEQIHGHLHSKRQYQIEDGELLGVRDIDLTTNDELLQEALAGKADVRLTEIISTIQSEQNDIIRASLHKPIIVQGAAGSGKTTIALHRISYFLYTMGTDFPADKLMILAPSKLFMDYIADVLPELGVGAVNQTTYEDYVLAATGLNLNLTDPNGRLERLASSASAEDPAITVARLKGSGEYRRIMERYIRKLEAETAALFEDVFIDKYRIMGAKRLRNLFLEDFGYLPIEKRLERIRLIMNSEVTRKRKQLYALLSDKYEEALDKALYGIKDDEKRRLRITMIMDERDVRLPAVEREGKRKVSSYMKRFKKFNVKSLYRTWLTDSALQEELAPEWTEEFTAAFRGMHTKNTWESEDLAALYDLHIQLKGLDGEWKMRAVFIDEAQDYSEYQLAALHDGLGTDLFTLVGDLAQGIHSYRALTSWEPVLQMLPEATYTTLQKSYRTTIEVMELANTVLAQMDEDLPLVEPVVRHGIPPVFHEMDVLDSGQLKLVLEEIASRGHRSVAMICKTMAEAQSLTAALEQAGMAVQLLMPDSDIDESRLLIVPSVLSKGLEFDAVLIAAYTDPFRDTAIDRKLLYVAMTRPMHELHILGRAADALLG
ncbi:RNA polymerase recycling motor HelD [Sporosarcina trichiuri]|uniref:RNA polymerase recycling motor HelD n=1 Tax=Sporosarcina trichiuri TaxID=3056445 RepID=UPI0025B55B88|nr:RNA polymerase recycling motor HelD [Sporosarcina sp. 0.2-SM1T-5]WJY26300.1 RNA polymerase recycling motor HelD [Sporosarcina sp. 0.2-SM1T-5]